MKHGKAKSRKTAARKRSPGPQPDTPSQAGARRARASSNSSVGNTEPVAKRNKHAVTVEEIPDEDDSADEDEEGQLGNVLIIAKNPLGTDTENKHGYQKNGHHLFMHSSIRYLRSGMSMGAVSMGSIVQRRAANSSAVVSLTRLILIRQATCGGM
jgi:hypothetical protein